jgi:hypothetical protein
MVYPLVMACMRRHGPYRTLPLSDPAEGTPSQLCDNPDFATPGPAGGPDSENGA